MKIDEAIKVLTEEASLHEGMGWHKDAEAVKLGIEALKVVKDAKAVGHYGRLYLLPGETED